jgi:gliding motility-associated-like protein
VQVFDANTAPASAGPDQDLCTPQTSTTLQASTVAMPGMGTWSIVQGGGTISDVNDPFATISDLQVGVTVLEWTVDNGPCGGITTSQMTITLFDENNPVADAGADQELCTPGGTTTGTTLAGSAVIFPAVGTWTLVSGDAQIADPNDPNSAVTDLGVGVHTFQWTVSNGVCADPVTIDEVTIAVYDADNPVANAGPDQQVCTPVTQAVMGATPAIFPAVGTWTVVSGSGDIQDVNDPLTVITDLGMGTNVFRWTVYNGACPEGTTFDEVTIVLFDANAPPADAGPDQELCYPDTETTLAANPTVGAAVGTWTVVAGTGQFADPNDNTTVVTGLSIGVNTFAWTIESGDCATTTDQVNILVFDPQNADAFAGLDQALCMPQDSVFMAGSPLIAPATGTWTLVSGSGIPVDPNDPLTLIEGLSVGPNVFQWTVYNGVCANSITDDLVTITLYSDSTAAANAGPDLSICLPMTSIFLQAETPPAPAVGTWTLIQGGGTIVNPNDPQTEVIDLQQGNNVFVWTLEWDPCPNNGVLSDTMVVSVFDPFAPVANAGGDQFFCTPVTTTTMAANVPATPGVGSWTVLSGTVEVEDPADPATVVSGLTVGVHELVWTITNGECGFAPPTTADTVRIHVYDGTAPEASTGDDIRWCTPVSSAVLQANDPVFPATGIWTALSGTGTIVDPNDPLTAVLGLGVGQHDFQWTIDNGPCGSSSAIISVFIHDGDSDPADAGADQALCGPIDQAQMAGNAPVFPAVGEWTLVSGGGVFADPSDPLSTVTGLQFGDNVFQWTIDNGPCGTTDDLVTITLYDSAQAAADAGPDQQLCTPVNSVNLQANAVVAPATGMWTIVSGTGDISDPTDPQAVITNIGPGVIVLQWSISNGPCTQGPTTDEVTIEIFDGSAAVAAAGPDQSFCTPIVGDVTMFASSPVPPGFGQWELISGTADIADPASPFSAITGLTPGEHIFRWTVHNGACGSTSDEMSIMVYDHTVAAADAGPDQQFCQDVSATQLEAAPTSSTAYGTWTALGSGTIASPNDPGTDVTGLPQGDHWFVWTVHNGDCGTTADTMLVRIKDCLTLVIPDAFSPNGDGVNDTYVIHNLESYPDNSFQVFNRWGNKVLDRSPYNNDWDGTNQFGSVFGEQLPESTYYYVLDLNNGDQPYTGFIYLRR